MARRLITQTDIDTFKRLHDGGLSSRQIADRTHWAVRTVQEYLTQRRPLPQAQAPIVRDVIWLPNARPTAKQIIAQVAARRSMTPEDLTGGCRTRKIAHARHEAMWEIRERLGHSFPWIAARLNLKDHTSAMYGVQKHEARLAALQEAA